MKVLTSCSSVKHDIAGVTVSNGASKSFSAWDTNVQSAKFTRQSGQFKFSCKSNLLNTLHGIITVGLLTTGKNKNRKNMAEFPKTLHIIPIANFPVTKLSILKLRKLQKITEIWSLVVKFLSQCHLCDHCCNS
jgi:hypothetical protein